MRTHEIDPAWNITSSLSPQILSRDANEIILFGKACKDLGYNELNWNMGCPYPRVAKKKRGSGLLPYPDLVEALLDDIKKELPLKLSIKCRLGYEDPHELDELIPHFNAFGLSELIVHARIGKQLYQGGVHKSALHKSQKPFLPSWFTMEMFLAKPASKIFKTGFRA